MPFQQTIRSDDRAAQPSFASPWVPEEIRFTALEWQVIALAERDPLSSIHEPGRIATAMGSIFGGHAHAKLADQRLEALRRIAVIAWHGPILSDGDIDDFLESGFSREHLHLLRRCVRRRRIANHLQDGHTPRHGFGIGSVAGIWPSTILTASAGASV